MTAELSDAGAGQVVAGRYRLGAPIGRGGFGAVFRAVDLRSDSPVALKMLLGDGLRHPAARARFEREADLARRLAHPHTVRLLDFGIADDGVPFIAWELLTGRSLEAAIAEGPLAPARVARIATQMLGSLGEAHALGIVHRDVKPANVFLCDGRDEGDFVKVLDFGIAKRFGSAGEQAASPVTRQGEVPGTPSYMAPEQLLGGPLTPAIDLYAVGLVMAEALSGHRVFGSESGVEILHKLISGEPTPLGAELIASPLGPVIERATKKNAPERYASAADMLEHLEAVAVGIRDSAPALSSDRVSDTAPFEDTGIVRPIPRDTLMPDTELAPRRAPPPAPTLIQAIPSVRARRRWVAPLIALVVVLVLTGAAAAVFLLGPPSLAGLGVPQPAASRRTRTRTANPPFKSLENPSVLEAVLTDEGWKVGMAPTGMSAAGNANVVNAVIERDGKSGFVMFQHFSEEAAATATEAGIKLSGGEIQCKRAAVLVLCVSIEGDPRGTKDLLAAITR